MLNVERVEVTATTEADRLALLHLIAALVDYQPMLRSASVPWSKVTPSLSSLALAHRVATLAHKSPAVNLAPEAAQRKLAAIAHRERLRGLWRQYVQSNVVSGLEQAGISTLVLKGQAFSALAYGDWSSRGGAADLDLLVAAHNLERAEATLQQLGFAPKGERRVLQPGSRLARYALWLHYERGWYSSNWGSIDLHWRALPGGAEWNTGENLLRHGIDVDLPLGSVRTLCPTHALIVACSQGESENWSRLRRLADLAAIEQLCSQQDIAKASELSSLVLPSLRNQVDRWMELPLHPMLSTSRVTRIANLWRMRTGSGSTRDAAVRSVLGAFAPSRKMGRRDQVETCEADRDEA